MQKSFNNIIIKNNTGDTIDVSMRLSIETLNLYIIFPKNRIIRLFAM